MSPIETTDFLKLTKSVYYDRVVIYIFAAWPSFCIEKTKNFPLMSPNSRTGHPAEL